MKKNNSILMGVILLIFGIFIFAIVSIPSMVSTGVNAVQDITYADAYDMKFDMPIVHKTIIDESKWYQKSKQHILVVKLEDQAKETLKEHHEDGYIAFKVNKITYSRFEVGELIEPIKDAEMVELPNTFNKEKIQTKDIKGDDIDE